MELRHLRYFIAVAEEGSLTVAAVERLHTAQPSLSRQMRDLEAELGCELMIRSTRGADAGRGDDRGDPASSDADQGVSCAGLPDRTRIRVAAGRHGHHARRA